MTAMWRTVALHGANAIKGGAGCFTPVTFRRSGTILIRAKHDIALPGGKPLRVCLHVNPPLRNLLRVGNNCG